MFYGKPVKGAGHRSCEKTLLFQLKHVYLHIQFVKRNFLDHRVKKPSLPLLNFKTGHFALRREENIVEFLEGRFHNQQLSLVEKRKVSIQLNFPFPLMSFKENVKLWF